MRDTTTLRTLTIEDALSIREIMLRVPLALSPEGRYVAVTLAERWRTYPVTDPLYQEFTETGLTRDIGPCRIRVTDAASGDTFDLGVLDASTWAPVWSPDGRRLAYFSDEGGNTGVWTYAHNTGQTRRISPRITRSFYCFEQVRWSPDGRSLMAKVLPDGWSIREANARICPDKVPDFQPATVRVWDTDDEATQQPNVRERSFANLVLLDVETGNETVLARETYPVWYEFSTDGAFVAYMELAGFEDIWTPYYRLHVISLLDHSDRVLLSDITQPFGINVAWSPDSRHIAVMNQGTWQYGIVTIADGALVTVTAPEGVFAHHRETVPVWLPDGRAILATQETTLWRIDAKNGEPSAIANLAGYTLLDLVDVTEGCVLVLGRSMAGQRNEWLRVDTDTGNILNCLSCEQEYTAMSRTLSPDGHTFAFTAESVTEPPDVWCTDITLSGLRHVTDLNPHLRETKQGKSRVIEWVTEDRETVRGALLLPAEPPPPGARSPLIVGIYGTREGASRVARYGILGPAGSDFPNLQLLASRGYAVLIPDMWTGGGDMMADHARIVLSAVDKVIAMGVADPDQLGIIGHSEGGYGVLSLIVQTNRFRAAVAQSLHADWLGIALHTEEGSTLWTGYAAGRLGATLWEDPERYRVNSPIWFLDRVETPLLLIHGSEDATCPRWFAEQVFVGLKFLGKKVNYALYEGEEHVPAVFSHHNRIDYMQRVLRWFERYLTTPSGVR